MNDKVKKFLCVVFMKNLYNPKTGANDNPTPNLVVVNGSGSFHDTMEAAVEASKAYLANPMYTAVICESKALVTPPDPKVVEL